MREGKTNIVAAWLATVFLGILGCGAGTADAHCDSLDGPVLVEARAALRAGDVTPLLKWVAADHEDEIRAAFAQVVAVRTKGADVREVADRFFFETLVRLHRAGEGAPFTGLKAAGTAVPAVVAADEALAEGAVDDLAETIASAVSAGIRERFEQVTEKKSMAGDSVADGREFVAAYVEYVHFIEGVHDMVTKGAGHAHGERPAAH
jgi:hypothetical protein